MSNILDAINVKLNTFGSRLNATDEKIGVEATTARGAEAALAARTATLEQDRDSMGSEIALINSKLDALSARVDALVGQLTELTG